MNACGVSGRRVACALERDDVLRACSLVDDDVLRVKPDLYGRLPIFKLAHLRSLAPRIPIVLHSYTVRLLVLQLSPLSPAALSDDCVRNAHNTLS